MDKMSKFTGFTADDDSESAFGGDFVFVFDGQDGVRLDIAVSDNAKITRSAAQRLIENGCVAITAAKGNIKTQVPLVVTKKNYKLSSGEKITVSMPENEDCDAFPEDIPLDIRYEDDDIIIVNKPVGMVVHPAPGHSHGTLVNALIFHCGSSLSGIGGVKRPGIVHRIDRDTTGLICAAKNDSAHLSLAAQLADHSMHREYRMIVVGNLREDEGRIDAPIGRKPGGDSADRKKMAVITTAGAKSRYAVTNWRVLERFSEAQCSYTYAEAVLETGRTHQIRVHMSYIGHPLMGDVTYGGGRTAFEKRNTPLLDGQLLHACALILRHPRTGETMRFETPLPANFVEILEKLRKTQQSR